MSTTVTYKGQTLTTVENQTKTLNTAGTWVEGDFTLTDASLDVSDTTATASDVAQGKVFYSNTGTRTTGTASGGGSDTLAQRATNTLVSYSSNDITTVVDHSFSGCTALETVSLPNCSALADYAFNGCTNLVSFSSTSNITNGGRAAFMNCSSMTSFPFDKLTGNAVNNSQDIFNGCSSLMKIYAPNATGVAGFTSGQFSNCIALVSARFPASTTVMRSGTFNGDSSLKLADLGECRNIGSAGNIFNNCTNLEVLILRKTSMVAVRSTEFANATNKIDVYVPSNLVSTYQSGTNWSTLYANDKVQFLALENSPYEATDFDDSGLLE